MEWISSTVGILLETLEVSGRFTYVSDLKENGILEIKWPSGESNPADLYAKNLDSKTAAKHIALYCGEPTNGDGIDE